MKTRFSIRTLCLAMVLLMAVTLLGGCGGSTKDNSGDTVQTNAALDNSEITQVVEKEPPLLEISFAPRNIQIAQIMMSQSPDDVVTPYIEKKFNIKLKDVIQVPNDSTIEQAVAMWIAANNLPDALECGISSLPALAQTGKFADLTEYARQMPNYFKYFPEKYWDRTNIDGKQYSIHGIQNAWPPSFYDDDPYYEGVFSHCMFVREDILAKAGYSFTPVDEIKKNTTEKGIKPTVEQFAISPAIDTPDKFYEMLKKIKDLNLTVNGKPLIPMSILPWQQFHIGSMFDFGYWRLNKQGEVDGWFGLPGAKDYYKWIANAYNEGILDKDFLLHKDEEYQEKVSSGRVAVGMAWMPDYKGAQQALQQVVPEGRFRFIPFPKTDPQLGWYDVVVPGGYWHVMVKADMPAENIKRLTEYWDWLLSDEGQETASWGPEEGGLWEIKDGKKVFKDEKVANDCLNKVRNGNGADRYGLMEATQKGTFSPLVHAAPEIPTEHLFFRSYPAKLDFDEVTRNLLGRNSQNFTGSVAVSDNTKLVSDVSNWFWGEFSGKTIAKLLKTKTDSEFDAAYEQIMKDFIDKSNYNVAKKQMEEWFERFPPFN